MTSAPLSTPPGFWTTLRLLLLTARKRGLGRGRRQRELLGQKLGKKAVDWQIILVLVALAAAALINSIAASFIIEATKAGQRIEIERQGQLVVHEWFLSRLREAEKESRNRSERLANLEKRLGPYGYDNEARTIAMNWGGDREIIATRLRDAAQFSGAEAFVGTDAPVFGLTALPASGALAAVTGSLALLCWWMMVAFQGEGVEFDITRRRHPMWEWLFSHPAPPGAIFLAEMLAPIAANPVYWCAPLCPAILYGVVYGAPTGVAAAALIGAPLVVAAACFNKAFEIAVVLRLPPRSRGAALGLTSWIGLASMALIWTNVLMTDRPVAVLAELLAPFTPLKLPLLALFLGQSSDGSFSFPMGLLFCWTVAACVIAGAVSFSVWGARRGLAGGFGAVDDAPPKGQGRIIRFGEDPLYRKETLWFLRDRGAIVQAVLIPVTMAGFQLVSWRQLITEAGSAWNVLCGAAVLFGTFFLTALGPRSLASEGRALWITLTWPRGLESLLKAKARLWSLISSAVIAPILLYAAVRFPGFAWKIAIVGVLWLLFARSLAEKAVTLASPTPESGEAQKIPMGRHWAVFLGAMTFATGVMTQQWSAMITGVVYSVMTAAAMWENFRARLPYLYDPWSEKLPPAPTLMHAMIAISAMTEGGAVTSGVAALFARGDGAWIAMVAGYGVSAVIVSVCVASFLTNRGVPAEEIWFWRARSKLQWSEMACVATGVGLGVSLGIAGLAYIWLLRHFPFTAEALGEAALRTVAIPHMNAGLLVMSVLIAPIAEEYLFRGLLYRALDRQWGGWRAVLGSAAFFAIYHPAISWLPVGLVGMANALLFKKAGRLSAAVALHLVYNCVLAAGSL